MCLCVIHFNGDPQTCKTASLFCDAPEHVEWYGSDMIFQGYTAPWWIRVNEYLEKIYIEKYIPSSI